MQHFWHKKRLGYTNISGLIGKEIKGKYTVKKMNELTKKTNCKVQNRHEIIAISIIMQTRLSRPETIKFRSDLGFNQINLILKK